MQVLQKKVPIYIWKYYNHLDTFENLNTELEHGFK